MKKIFFLHIFLSLVFFLNRCQTSLWKETPPQKVSLPVKDLKSSPPVMPSSQTDSIDDVSLKPLAQAQPDDRISLDAEKNSSEKKITPFLFPQNQIAPKGGEVAPSFSRSQDRTIHYSGDVFLREKKYHARVKKNVPVLTINGHVRVQQGNLQLTASKIEIIGENGEIFLIPTRVRIVDTLNNSLVEADYAEYHRFSKTAFFKKNCLVKHSSHGQNKITIRSHELQQNFQKNISYAFGNVKITSPLYKANSHKAVYWQNDAKLSLQGDAYVYQDASVYHAQEINYLQEQDILEMKTDISIWNTAIENKNSGEPTGKVITLITADKARREKKTLPNMPANDYITQFFSSPQKQVQLTRNHIFFYADAATLIGENEMQAKGSLKLIDREAGHLLFAEQASFSTDGRLIQFFAAYNESDNRRGSEKQLILPQVILADKEKKPSSFITSNHIEKDDRINKISARGQVIFEMLSPENKNLSEQVIRQSAQKRDDSIFLGGELAELPTGEENVHLSGNPYILQEQEKIFARKIIINIDAKSIKLEGNLQSGQQDF